MNSGDDIKSLEPMLNDHSDARPTIAGIHHLVDMPISKQACDENSMMSHVTIEKSTFHLQCSEIVNCKQSNWPSLRLLLTGIFVVLGGGFHFGFLISILNPMAEPVQQFMISSLQRRYQLRLSETLTNYLWSSLVGIVFIGSVIGASIIPNIMIKIGSRWSLVITSVIMIFGLILAPIARILDLAELLFVSRFIAGFCAGMGTTVQSVFLTEISPVSCRGLMGTLTGLSTNIGVIVASTVGLPQLLGTTDLWPNTYYIQMIPCLMLFLFGIIVLHESPIHYLRRGDERRSENAIRLYYRESQLKQTENPLEKLKASVDHNGYNAGLIEILRDRASRRALYYSVLLNITVSFSGIVALSAFGTFLLAEIGFTTNGAALANCLSSLAGTVGVLTGTFTVDKVGRRFLIIGSLLSLIVVNSVMMILVWLFLNNHYTMVVGYLFLLFLVIFLFVFSVGIGPMAWFISTELSLPDHSARVQSISISSQYLTCFLCPIIYLQIQQLHGPLSFLIFIIPLTFTSIYFHLYLPETRNRTIDEIRVLLST